ncbi:MAG: hypothetical protein Kow00122_00440 [Thermoleophilia bacterium]
MRLMDRGKLSPLRAAHRSPWIIEKAGEGGMDSSALALAVHDDINV